MMLKLGLKGRFPRSLFLLLLLGAVAGGLDGCASYGYSVGASYGYPYHYQYPYYPYGYYRYYGSLGIAVGYPNILGSMNHYYPQEHPHDDPH